MQRKKNLNMEFSDPITLSQLHSSELSEQQVTRGESNECSSWQIIEKETQHIDKIGLIELQQQNIKIAKEETVTSNKFTRETTIVDRGIITKKGFKALNEDINDNIFQSQCLQKYANDNTVDHYQNKDVDCQCMVESEQNKETSSTDVCMKEDHKAQDLDNDYRLPNDYFVVVAIDFGTTYSGYAFSFIHEPDNIHMMRKWEGGDPGVNNQKIPTTLLLCPDGSFHSFGYSARDNYHDLNPNEAIKWFYFEKFKLVLHHSDNLNIDTSIKAANGKEFSALEIFTHALKFFKDHVIQEMNDQSALKINEKDIKWVLTVPAIWKASSKQFMREAAYKAGIASISLESQLCIALEPEAASIYVRRLKKHELVPDISDTHKTEFLPKNTAVADQLTHGTSYMIVDCGGGTVDITVHELNNKSGNIKEIYKATGGPYGSISIDMEFERLLVNIFGDDFIKGFKTKRPVGWIDLMIAFESRKRAANLKKTNALNVALPFSFIDFYKKIKGSQVEIAIRKYKDPNIRWSTQGMLRLTQEAMWHLFKRTLDKITGCIGDVLNIPSVKALQNIFLVGGFSESSILQQHIRKEFGHLCNIIIPRDVCLAVVKGAVLFGHDPSIVQVRRSKQTYGVGVLNRFVHGKHPVEKLITKDGSEWCVDVFDKFVKSNQALSVGDKIARIYTPVTTGQKVISINIYASERSGVTYISDDGVKKIGSLILQMNDLQYQTDITKRREIVTEMAFGGTEINVSAIDRSSGKFVKANIDFLN